MIFKKYTFWDLATYTKFSVQITSFCPHLHTYTWYSNSNAMTKRETKIREKQKPLSTTACTKKSVFVDTNRFRNGCFCTNMCKACTCFKVDLITTPVGALKIIELVREFFRQKPPSVSQWSGWSNSVQKIAAPSKWVATKVGSDAGRWKTLGGPVLMVGIICPPPVGIGLTDLPNIGGASGPPGPPSSGTTALVLTKMYRLKNFQFTSWVVTSDW